MLTRPELARLITRNGPSQESGSKDSSVPTRRCAEVSGVSASRRWVVVLTTLVTGFGCAASGPQPAAPPREVVATVDHHEISLQAVDQRIKDDLFEQEFGHGSTVQLHHARRQTLDELIESYLLERAADLDGLTVDEWLERASSELPPVTQAEIQVFFDENREQIGDGVTLDELAPQIRAYLEHTRRTDISGQLRREAVVDIQLSRPRVQVAHRGPSLGPETASVTIVAFGDYQCPFCARSEPVIRELLERYPESLRLIHRHLPLSMHAEARGAAEAAVCAEAQQRFWDYHDLLFANQRALGRDALLDYARQLGLDVETFESCLNSEQTVARVEEDMRAAREAGASGTPAFFINGIMLSGAQPIEEFEALVEEELQRPGE